ncbi:endopeptidase [Janibacter melonis]|uniref:Endopeptidase n=1 Tax=Janibacter melonis TaxID=262209 RepID=A0A176QA98_9MICO|nr:endopeptidase [Janibacter melonis]
MQRSLARLGYWGGTADGTYGGLTEQAVLALQKQAGLDRDGVAGPRTLRAVAKGTRPTVGAGRTDRVEIDLERQLLYVVRDGSVQWAISTSTGSGETYESSYDGLAVAVTPPGTFAVGRVYDGSEVATLGTLYRPRYFNGGIAVHGAASVPGWPASHGCARVSDPAMDLIWSQDLMPVGSTVVVR